VDEIVEKEEGDDLNPRECDQYSKRLLKQIRTTPLRSSIARNRFGYDRIPASNAPVEIGFNSIKIKVERSKCRIDTDVDKLITYFNGSTKFIDCSAINKENFEH